jgi:streptogramin lyase
MLCRLVAFVLFAGILAQAAAAAVIEGIVRTADGPVAGALVTLVSADRLFGETVYSGADGRYVLATGQSGAAELRVRYPEHDDVSHPLRLAGGATLKLDVELRPMTSLEARSGSLTASAHYKRIRFDDPVEHAFFRIECLTCHQLGNAYTRAARSQEEWTRIVTRMLGFFRVTEEERIARYVGVLSAAFDGKPSAVRQQHTVDPLIFVSRIIEWKLPEGVIAHDVEYREADGRFYTVDQGNDRIYITDPRSNHTETYHIPNGGIPIGGKFLELFNDPHPFSLAVSRGPHSLQEGPDGRYYTTDTVSSQIGAFDPETRTFESYEIGNGALYPHTLRFDARGQLWFTIAVSNQVGRFDPASGAMTVINLPTTTDRPSNPVLMPYGIDIHPLDGSVWYTRLMANRIGRIDADTLELKEIRPPAVGPRRMRFAKDGTLWIPAFSEGSLLRLDTATMEFTTYPMPVLSPGELEAPYAVGIHPVTQEVWITANMSDRMFRFLPAEERFVAYPLPTRGTYLRDVVFTPGGLVCAASSPAPAPLAVEGGMQAIICIDPGSGN